MLGLFGDGVRFRFVRKAPLLAFNASKGALRTCGDPDLITGSDIWAFLPLINNSAPCKAGRSDTDLAKTALKTENGPDPTTTQAQLTSPSSQPWSTSPEAAAAFNLRP